MEDMSTTNSCVIKSHVESSNGEVKYFSGYIYIESIIEKAIGSLLV